MANPFRTNFHRADFCIVGGGMAGLCAALSAARHGMKVVLMHDRPVLGGNASSECRVHICGADRHNQVKNMRETGILEELRLENLYRNPNRIFSVWDTILLEKAWAEPNLTLLLNCTCQSLEMDGNLIHSITGWQLTTQTYHTIEARLFADCSGDGILAPLSQAEFRMGREARHEFNESIEPEQADDKTMGMTILFQTRKYPNPQPFESPPWAHHFEECEDLPYGNSGHHWWQMGYWWVELGGERHSIHDTEALRDELLKTAYGVWDHIKNHCPEKKAAENWALDWVQFMPAKRESRRYIGEHIQTQNDIESGGHFDDLVAYGGWTMDDHHPAGFNAVRINAPATIFHRSPSPYGISYRCLYSRNIGNLLFAGRNASFSHAAMSSSRVMGTACSMGQAVGVSAALAIQKGSFPSGMKSHIHEIQQALLHDDAYLPWIKQEFSKLTLVSTLIASHGDPQSVRDGINRPVGNEMHSWMAQCGDWIAYIFPSGMSVESVTLLLDSALEKNIQMSYHQKDDQLTSPPDTMPKTFRLESLIEGNWMPLFQRTNNHQRLVRLQLGKEMGGIRFVLDETWGSDWSRVFAFYID